MAILLQNRQRRLRLCWPKVRPWAEAVLQASGLEEGEVGLRLVSEKEIQELNARFRGEDCPTDILSFSFIGTSIPGEAAIVGDIVISGDATLAQAQRYGHSPEQELKVLWAHGVAHLMGYRDYTAEERRVMRRVERRLGRAADVALSGR